MTTRRIIIYPYKMGSGSSKRLADALGARRVWPDRNYRPRQSDFIINWGNSTQPSWWPIAAFGGVDIILNAPVDVGVASNKLRAFNILSVNSSISIPRYTTDPRVAHEWDHPVMVRYNLQGHSGAGCVYVEPPHPIPDAPLYVEYIKKAEEYRVHVIDEEIIDLQIKKRVRTERRGEEGVNFKIRSHHTGWVYCRDGIEDLPDSKLEVLRTQAILAVVQLGLDFGAVDIIWNNHYGRGYVLEVNTAPGLFGTTLIRYAEKFKELAGV